jgi:hypothetical protein
MLGIRKITMRLQGTSLQSQVGDGADLAFEGVQRVAVQPYKQTKESLISLQSKIKRELPFLHDSASSMIFTMAPEALYTKPDVAVGLYMCCIYLHSLQMTCGRLKACWLLTVLALGEQLMQPTLWTSPSQMVL